MFCSVIFHLVYCKRIFVDIIIFKQSFFFKRTPSHNILKLNYSTTCFTDKIGFWGKINKFTFNHHQHICHFLNEFQTSGIKPSDCCCFIYSFTFLIISFWTFLASFFMVCLFFSAIFLGPFGGRHFWIFFFFSWDLYWPNSPVQDPCPMKSRSCLHLEWTHSIFFIMWTDTLFFRVFITTFRCMFEDCSLASIWSCSIFKSLGRLGCEIWFRLLRSTDNFTSLGPVSCAMLGTKSFNTFHSFEYLCPPQYRCQNDWRFRDHIAMY